MHTVPGINPRTSLNDQPARVLIVDNEPANLRLIMSMLEPEGYALLTASSGEEALAIVEAQPPDLILLDIMMPGMNGYEVAGHIKRNFVTRNIPIILITALNDHRSKMLGLNAGAEDFLGKPVDRVELSLRVRNLLRLKAYGDHFDKYSQSLEGLVAARTVELLDRTDSLQRQGIALAAQAALLNLAQDAIILRDLDSAILLWNSGAEAMYGWSSAEVLGKTTYEVLEPEFTMTREQVMAMLLRDGHWEGDAVHYRRDGSQLIVSSRWALQHDDTGKPVGILTVNRDITERIHADADRFLLTERLSLATEAANVGVWDWDLASNTVTWDATMFNIYGMTPVLPLPYQSWASAVVMEDLPAVEAELQRTISEKGKGSAEFRIVHRDGSIRNIATVERVLLDENNVVSRVIGVNRDITEQRLAEKTLETTRQEQLRFKDDFLSHVSHELRSPLTAIKQFTSILLGGTAGELNPTQREYEQIVLKNILQLQSMIDDLLEVTRLETRKLIIKREAGSMADAVSDTFNTLYGTAHAKKITLSFDAPSQLPTIYADPMRVRQIMIILLDNAIKFTPSGGSVTVRARPRDDDRSLQIDVTDTGAGITRAAAARVFDRYYQTADATEANRKGLGLGLYICKELVVRQGGEISARPGTDGGSTLSFTLPLFTLRNIIAPLLVEGHWPDYSAAMVVVESAVLEGSMPKDTPAERSVDARHLVQSCLAHETQVLLPTRADGESGHLAILAFTDEPGAKVLVSRIQQRPARVPEQQWTGVVDSVSYRMLELPRRSRLATSPQTLVDNLVGLLEQELATLVTAKVES